MKDFDEFWTIWPRKVGRKPAELKWSNLTEDQKSAAIADVGKRNRFKAWSNNPRLIPHAGTYLNQERWTDEWMGELKTKSDDLPNTGPYIPRVQEPEINMHWAEQMMNRAFKWYCFLHINCGGMKEVDTALRIKRELMEKEIPEMDRGIESGQDVKVDVAKIICSLFLERLDLAYGTTLKNRVLHQASTFKGQF